MKDRILPTVTIEVPVIFQAGVPYVNKPVEVEVLSIHFQKRTMRVRYMCEDYFGRGPKIETPDVSAEPFFKKYKELGHAL